MNRIIVSGYLGRDSVLRYTQQGSPVLDFSMGVKDWHKGKGAKALFLDVAVFGQATDTGTARMEKLQGFLLKGQQVLVEGRLDVEKVEKEGKHYTNITIYTNEVELLDRKPESPEETPAE